MRRKAATIIITLALGILSDAARTRRAAGHERSANRLARRSYPRGRGAIRASIPARVEGPRLG